MSKIVRNTILLGVSEVFSKGISALAMILLVRKLSPEGFGIYSLAITLTYYFVGFLHSGFYTIGMREVSKFPDYAPNYVKNIFILKIIFGIVSYALLSAIIFLLDKPPEVKSAYLLAGLFLFILVFHIDWVFRGLEKMEFPAIGSILQGIALLVFIYLFVHSKNDYKIAIWGYLLSWLILVTFLNVIFIKKYGIFKFDIDLKTLKEILKLSLPISVASVLIVIYANVNIMVLNIYKGDYETGIYSAMIRLMNVLLLPNGILQMAFFPELSRSVLEGNFNATQRKYLLVDFIVAFFLVFGVFGYSGKAIELIFGPKYLVGELVLRISLVSCILSYFSASLTAATYALNRQSQFLKSSIVGSVVAITLNLLLIPKYSSVGAVISLVITEASVFLSLAYFNRKLNIIHTYTEVVKPFFVGIISILLAKALEIYTNSIIGILVYFMLFWAIAFLTKLITIEQVKKIFSFRF
jgi:O-antigen/teichoic acid export membrane protein